jgi:hypothetical protein
MPDIAASGRTEENRISRLSGLGLAVGASLALWAVPWIILLAILALVG